MDETILFPSPNWFQPSGMAVSNDEWLIYGGPSKSLCVLEPLPQDYDTVVKGNQAYTAHVVNRAHYDKIVCVDICPEWPEKRCVLTGSSDGAVKQWLLDQSQENLKIKSTHSHEIHSHDKEEVAGVGYCMDGYAVTVGSFGNIVKWDLNSNVVKSFNHVLKSFKPVCMACSPHVHMHVAIGTKQGVVFVLDLNGSPRIIYKVRGQDDEILRVTWCPQYEVAVRKSLKESDRRSKASERLEKIQKEPETPETLKELDERVKNSQTTEQPVRINEKCEPIIDTSPSQEVFDESGTGKTLPEDSFDDITVQEDDMFDIYKDHEADEFGHKKFQPYDVLVKVPIDSAKDDYLSECQTLKDEIMKRKSQSDATIGELVDAMDKTELDVQPCSSKQDAPVEGRITKGEVESSVHIHKHLLATIGKQGSIRVWSKSGKLVGSCAVAAGAGGGAGGGRAARRGAAGGAGGAGPCGAGVWAEPDSLLVADGKSQLLECNPLRIDCKNKLEWVVLHAAHSRGVHAVCAAGARVQTPDMRRALAAWSAGQDRRLVRCARAGPPAARGSCGGFLYTVKPCPYDASRIAVSVGDGAVRVWETDTLEDDERSLTAGRLHKYWQNVQGKVLVTAWHPEKEHLLAFATAESRVGLLDTGGRSQRPATLLQPAGGSGVYSLCWGLRSELLVCSQARLALYHADRPDQAPTTLEVQLEGSRWEVSAVAWGPRGPVVGSQAGAVGLLAPDYSVQASALVFNKMIHTIEWHPQQTSSSAAPAPHRDLLAVCSLDRANTVVVLHYAGNEDGSSQLTTWKTLTGHKNTVLQVTWNPHRDEQLLSTSQDGTVRVWDITSGECISIFGRHGSAALGASWSPQPSLPDVVISGGTDYCLRLWDTRRHPAARYQETKHEVLADRKNKNKNKREKKSQERREEEPAPDTSGQTESAVSTLENRRKQNKKFLLPLVHKQTTACTVAGARYVLQRYLERVGAARGTEEGAEGTEGEAKGTEGGAEGAVGGTEGTAGVVEGAAGGPEGATGREEHGLDYIKLFGTINEVNELLDIEMERHQDTGNLDSWAMLNIFRGQIDQLMQASVQADRLDPFLISLAPSVSFKYWKEVILQYILQIDRLTAKGEDLKLIESKAYGGAVYRRVAVQLGLHDLKPAVGTLLEARLYKEAYALCRTRYMESLAVQTLRVWAEQCDYNSQHNLAAVCYITLDDLPQAAASLGKSSDEESLSLAADIAKILGQNIFAGHIEEKRDLIKNQKELEKQDEKDLQELPTRVELVMKDIQDKDVTGEGDKEDDVETNEGTDSQAQNDKELAADESLDTNITEEVQSTTAVNAVKDQVACLKDPIEESVGDNKIEKTEKILESLPEKMEGLMKDVIPSGTHKGDGDTAQNGDVTEKIDGKEISVKANEKGDEMSQATSAE